LQARTGELLSGFLHARKGLKILKKVIEKDAALYDAYLGTGNYEYWASKYLKWFFWVPDKREQGISATELAVGKGKYCRWIGLNSLGYIYYDDGQYGKAAQCFREGLEQFPDTRFFLWGLADSYFKQLAYKEALKVYSQILTSLNGMSLNNGFNEIVCHFKMLKSQMALEAWEEALIHCNAILERKVEPRIARRLKSRIKTTSKLKKECLEQLGRIRVIRE